MAFMKRRINGGGYAKRFQIETVSFRKQKKVKIVQIGQSLAVFMSSVHGSSKEIIYRAIKMDR